MYRNDPVFYSALCAVWDELEGSVFSPDQVPFSRSRSKMLIYL